MTILLASQADISSNDGLGGVFGGIARDLGVTGFPGPRSPSKTVGALEKFRADVAGTLNALMGRANAEQFDPNFVGSGKQVVPGGASIEQGKVAPLESASVRKVYSQAPAASVIVKKRAFSSLNNLYDPTLMDPAELWLFRATKRLFLRKCAELRDYETLTKIQKLTDAGASSRTAILSLVSNLGSGLQGPASDSGANFFSSAFKMEQIARDREPVRTTTWFVEPDLPMLPELGVGSGVFEITLVTNLNTNLSIDGNGGCSVSLQNPYNIMMVTEHDIEMAVRDTALAPLVNAVSSAAGLALSAAQGKDASLQQRRQARGRSAITFTVDVGAGRGATAVIDALGFQITENNLDLVPKGHELDSAEQALFKATLKGLEAYSSAMRRDLAGGSPLGGNPKNKLKTQMDHARKMMRKFYLGRLIIQPMDTIHVFLDGGTRRPGEGEEVSQDRSIFSKEGQLGMMGSILGLQDSRQIDNNLMRAAWRQSGKHLQFKDFKKISTLDTGGVHVFAGLVTNVSDSFSDGAYTVNVSGNSNMEWLRISRYNKQPSLDQTQAIIYDPLTPFDFETDEATGLPKGKPKLSSVNQERISGKCRHYVPAGDKTAELINSIDELLDFKNNGGDLVPVFNMPPGLVYKWKEGIVTATYDMSTVNPLDSTKVNARQLRRDVGFFASNTAFDNMDVANIISTMVVGVPYNPATFLQSGISTGAIALDTTLNSGKDYFHNLLDIRRSLNRVQGNWSPFKPLTTSPVALAESIVAQRKLSQQSSQLQQLRSQFAKISDDELRNAAAKRASDITPGAFLRVKQALAARKDKLQSSLKAAENEVSKDLKELSLAQSPLRIAGNDVTFDLGNTKSKEDIALFGDELIFVAQRRREDVIHNRDKNYFIVSDEYDKDFDIQAFNLQMARNTPNMWNGTWDDVLGLCQRAASIIDFEFFVNTQGHLELRPPQYNRTPVSVMDAMLTFNRSSGIKLLPDFITKLVSSREQTLLRDIHLLEWEIRKEIAILGGTDKVPFKQFLIKGGTLEKAINERRPLSDNDRTKIKSAISELTDITAIRSGASTFGLFSATSQLQLQRNVVQEGIGEGTGNEKEYNEAVLEISKLTGKPVRQFDTFERARVGALKNGVSSPSSDVAGAVTRIAQFVSRRDRLLGVLSRTLEQGTEIRSLDSSGTPSVSLKGGNFSSTMRNSDTVKKIVADDNANILGHLSGQRLVINDETIISSSFREAPPEITHISVGGTDPLVGERQGNIAGGFPLYLALGVDFDLWRQYGFRSERMVEKPFFWSAEQQCAPYAKMLLARQRKNIVTGTVTVIGNEFYQLGDVVYVSDRQMLYYVHRITHNFTFEGDFQTVLELNYGHPPGEYIPTPLDIIGKGLSNKADKQGAFRTRRFGPGTGPGQDQVLGVVKFPSSSKTSISDLLAGQHGKRNFQVLSSAAENANADLKHADKEKTPRVILITYGNKDSEITQRLMMKTVQDWFAEPREGASGGVISIGAADTVSSSSANRRLPKSIGSSHVFVDHLNQCVPVEQLNKSDLDLLRQGVSASAMAHTLDPTLGTVVEIRLRQPPPNGWPKTST